MSLSDEIIVDEIPYEGGGDTPKLEVEDVKEKINDFLDEVEKYDKNKLMGKEFIVISKKDLKKTALKHFGEKLIK